MKRYLLAAAGALAWGFACMTDPEDRRFTLGDILAVVLVFGAILYGVTLGLEVIADQRQHYMETMEDAG